MVSVGQTEEEFQKSWKKFHFSAEDINCVKEAFTGKYIARTVILIDGGQTMMRLPAWNGSPADRGILSHEIHHAVSLVMERICTRLCQDSWEVYAYLDQYITEEIEKRLQGVK